MASFWSANLNYRRGVFPFNIYRNLFWTSLVVDEETQKPVPNARVVIGWAVHYATVASSPRCYYKIVRTVSDAKGEFVVPPGLKTVNFSILSFYKQRFSGIDLRVYDTGYKYSFKEVRLDSDSEKIIRLMQIKTSSQLLKSAIETYNYLDIATINCRVGVPLTAEDVKFLKNSYYKLQEKFPDEFTDNFKEAYRLVEIEHRLKQPEAYLLLQKLLQKHKNIMDKDYYEGELRVYKKLYMHPYEG